MKTQSVRFSNELADRIDTLSNTTRRSKSSLIVEAVELYLQNQKDLELILSRFRDPEAEWVTHEEARRELGLD